MTIKMFGSLPSLLKTILRPPALWAGLLLCPGLAAAVSFTVTPSTVSNTYSGNITLNITGLNTSETVVVQKFLDLNANGAIDAGDWLVGQWRLTDGQATVIGGVTNINVPGDSTPPDAAITWAQSFVTAGVMPRMVGRYLYKLSSPTGRFSPSTNVFTVTNFAFGQSFSGRIRSSGTNVPYASVLLFVPSMGGGGLGSPIGGVIANGSGAYTINAPVGTYLPLPFQSHYVSPISAAPVLTLNAGATITTNLTLIPAPLTISGKAVDAANASLPLPGIMAAWSSTNSLIAIGFTDTNGNFASSVTGSYWKWGGDSSTLVSLGYLSFDNAKAHALTTTGSVGNVTVALPKGTALLYGTVKDNQNHPLAGVSLSAYTNNSNGNGVYEGDALSDQNGNYVMAIIGGDWNPQVNTDKTPGFGNYLFAQPNPLTITDGQAIQQNFVAILATNTISGYLKDSGNNPIANVWIWANATINGTYYQLGADTDNTGHYSFNVASGSWDVGVSSGGGGDNLPSNYFPPADHNITITNNNATVNFTAVVAAYHISGYLRDNSSHPIANVWVWGEATINGTRYYNIGATTDDTGHYSFGVINGTWDVGVSSGGGGGSLPSNYLSPSDQSITVNNNNPIVNFTAVPAPYQITGHVQQSNGNPIVNVGVEAVATINGATYYQVVGTDGNGNYSLSVANGAWSVNLWCSGGGGNINNLDNLLGPGSYQCPNSQNVPINNNNGTANFTVQPGAPVQIDTTSLPDATVGVYYSQSLNASGGQQPYIWSLSPGSASLPAWLTLNPSGSLTGTPTSAGTISFSVRVTDNNNNTADQPLQLNIDSTSGPLAISTISLPDGLVDTVYSNLLVASGGQVPYAWSMTPGSIALPAGLGLSNNGMIFGIPTTADLGTNYFSVRVTDARSQTADQLLALRVFPNFHITNSAPALPAAILNASYSCQFGAVGGNPYPDGYGYRYTWNSAPLPPGLGLSYAGYLSGTPTQTGTFYFQIYAEDWDGNIAQNTFSLVVGNGLQIATTSLNNATAGVGYTNQLQATGGRAPYYWSIALGSQPLPAGLTLSTDGLIAGVPSAGGTNSFIVRVTDATTASVTRSFTLVVTARPSISSPIRLSASQFRLTVNCVAGQNYTIQRSANLASWSTVLVTNSPASSFVVTDTTATDAARFYRVLVGP
jgi:hypothetical protein